MKYILFTYIDKKTGISAQKEPSMDELVLPNIEGLQVEWSNMSELQVPSLFGTCSDSADITVEGFIKEFTEEEWNILKQEKIINTFNCYKIVSNSNFRLSLLRNSLLESWEQVVKTLPKELQIYWEYSVVVDRTSQLILQAGKLLNLFEINPDTEVVEMDRLFNESIVEI